MEDTSISESENTILYFNANTRLCQGCIPFAAWCCMQDCKPDGAMQQYKLRADAGIRKINLGNRERCLRIMLWRFGKNGLLTKNVGLLSVIVANQQSRICFEVVFGERFGFYMRTGKSSGWKLHKGIDFLFLLWYNTFVRQSWILWLGKQNIWRSRLAWSRAHDWKSCNGQKPFEGSNPSFSAK